MRKIVFVLGLLLCIIAGSEASSWQKDVLGGDYRMRYVNQGSDYSGEVRSTIISLPNHCGCSGHKGILYVHGYNDYFLQKDMGEIFADSCYRFFAVDLRKYGRSLMPGQRKFEVRDMSEYFPDIDSAIAEMKRQGVDTIILMGHSTGGLTTALYMNDNPDPAIKALILNSPFLDWNQSKFQEKILLPVMCCLGTKVRNFTAVKGSNPIYEEPDSLVKTGEWGIIRDWKPTEWPDITSGWIHAIASGQSRLRKGRSFIKVPVLLMHSDRSFKKGDAESERDSTDDVLDVEDISRYGRGLAPVVTEATVPGGVHDLVRSAPGVRNAVYDEMFTWLRRQGL